MSATRLIAIFLLLASTSASAYYSTPRIEPASTVAGQAFDVLIDVGECHGFTVPFPGEPERRTEIDGNTVRLFEPGVIAIGWCGLPPATLRRPAPVLPAGEYRIEVHMIRLPQRTEIFLSSVNVVVGPAPSLTRTVPTFSGTGIGIAILLMLALASTRLARPAT